MEPRSCLVCGQRFDGAYVRCSACKQAFYCNVDCQKQHWAVHQNECKPKVTPQSPVDEPPAYASIALGSPTHNLAHVEIEREKETAMMEEFYNWRKIWFKTLVKCTISMLSCEPYGMDKLKTHGLALWVSERAEYASLDASRADLRERATKNKWAWNPDWWNEATAFKVAYARIAPWDDLIKMLECFPMEKSFLSSFRTLCPPNKLRIVVFLAPSFLSYDSLGNSRSSVSSPLPPPRWRFPPGSPIPSQVEDLIMRTMPFFEPLVTGYTTSGTTDPEDKTRYSHFDADSWEWIMKRVVELGWYSEDGRLWREFLDKMACADCRGGDTIPAEVRTGLTYLAKIDRSAKRVHAC